MSVFPEMAGLPPLHATNTVALYLHVPFCQSLCPYCAFYKQENPIASTKDSLVDALIAEIQAYAGLGLCVSSIFWGGGTPTLLTGTQFQKVYTAICSVFICSAGVEHTVEVNPETVSLALLTQLGDIGVTRISLGVQSFFDGPLTFLGRRHSAATVRTALDLLCTKFTNINIDFIYGLPTAVGQDIMEELAVALTYPITHISPYALTIEKGTVFAKQGIVSPDDSWEDYTRIKKMLIGAGFLHYEISAFARPGYACRHNMAYWQLQPYIGIGPSAASYWRGRSYKQVSDLAAYVQNPSPRIAKNFTMTTFETDYMLANFRRLDGISAQCITRDLGRENPYAKSLDELVAKGFLTHQGDCYILTLEGIRMHNMVLEAFV